MSQTRLSKRVPMFFPEDIVQSRNRSGVYGVVMRCWNDPHDHEHDEEECEMDPLLRPLNPGEIGVSQLPNGKRIIAPEEEFRLVDRIFQIGDYCKHSVEDPKSGVVTGINVEARLEHAISGVRLDGWFTVDDLQPPREAGVGDYVIYEDWVGQIMELFDEVIVEHPDRRLVRLPEMSSHLTVGEKGADILPPSSAVQTVFNFFGANTNKTVTVVAVTHTVLAICWLALNQSLSPQESQKRTRPERFWHGEDIAKLSWIRDKYELHVGDKVIMKDTDIYPRTQHGGIDGPIPPFSVCDMAVYETRTSVSVLWQDGTEDKVLAAEIIPHVNPSEADCWPGDPVYWKSDGEERPAIVQSVNARARTAKIRYCDNDAVETVSVLELDPQGITEIAGAPFPVGEGLGVHRGDMVFIHQAGASNGAEAPRVPRIGELEAWVRDPLAMNDGYLAGWRKDMAQIGYNYATNRGDTTPGKIKLVQEGDTSLNWFGQVTGLLLDGRVEVTHPGGEKALYSLESLTKLYDSIEQLEDIWADEDGGVEGNEDETDEAEIEWVTDENGEWQPAAAAAEDAGDWEDEEGDVEEEPDVEEDDSMLVDDEESQLLILQVSTSQVDSGTDLPVSSSPAGPHPSGVHIIAESNKMVIEAADPARSQDVIPGPSSGRLFHSEIQEDKQPLSWTRFEVQSSCPVDHAFYASPPAEPSKAFLGRLSKEYRVLSTSLPDSILVRAYEDRTDLLRSVIIGPANTPYEDAPFVIDWMLDSSFPQTPPIAHFLSWTNGNGRVNPNLYESGKVCLSILGTWAGEKTEVWNAARSSLLQAFVSIQGLVLVKEPWYCEPAYEKLRGTEEARLNSRMYSEKAYVLSRGFVRRALDSPVGGLESELNWLYLSQKRLDKVVTNARSLIEKSRLPADSGDDDAAVPRLTEGGIISLTRVLDKLEALQV